MAAKLYTPARPPGLRTVARRFALLLAILFATVLVLYFEGGLVDQKTKESPGLLDCLYFAMVTVTTVGYGDIVPVSTFARLTDSFLLTPVRFVVFLLFVGIAYDLAIKRFQEDYRMNRVVHKLKNHIVVCGFGETGRMAVRELLLQQTPVDQVVVVDTSEGPLEEAVRMGVVAVQGDATREHTLKSVAIDRAAHVLVCPGRDDSAVLIALTVHDLNPEAQLVVMCHETENVRLVERSGAHTIVSPASAGGNLMAAATRQKHLVATMKDLLSVGGAVRMDERPARADEVGRHPSELRHIAVLRVYRDDTHFDVSRFPVLESGDVLVFAATSNGGGE